MPGKFVVLMYACSRHFLFIFQQNGIVLVIFFDVYTIVLIIHVRQCAMCAKGAVFLSCFSVVQPCTISKITEKLC